MIIRLDSASPSLSLVELYQCLLNSHWRQDVIAELHLSISPALYVLTDLLQPLLQRIGERWSSPTTSITDSVHHAQPDLRIVIEQAHDVSHVQNPRVLTFVKIDSRKNRKITDCYRPKLQLHRLQVLQDLGSCSKLVEPTCVVERETRCNGKTRADGLNQISTALGQTVGEIGMWSSARYASSK